MENIGSSATGWARKFSLPSNVHGLHLCKTVLGKCRKLTARGWSLGWHHTKCKSCFFRNFREYALFEKPMYSTDTCKAGAVVATTKFQKIIQSRTSTFTRQKREFLCILAFVLVTVSPGTKYVRHLCTLSGTCYSFILSWTVTVSECSLSLCVAAAKWCARMRVLSLQHARILGTITAVEISAPSSPTSWPISSFCFSYYCILSCIDFNLVVVFGEFPSWMKLVSVCTF